MPAPVRHLIRQRLFGLRRSLHRLALARATWTFAAMVILLQCAVELVGGTHSARWIYDVFGLSRQQFQPWQLLSYGFVHGNHAHAILNACCLLMLGSRIEFVLGPRAVTATLVCGALGGAAAHLITASDKILVGCSGSVFALLLLLTTLSPDSRLWPLMVSGRLLGLGLLAASLFFLLASPEMHIPLFNPISGFLTACGFGSIWDVSHACHFGGGVAGWLCGRWMLRPRVSLATLRRDRARREGTRH